MIAGDANERDPVGRLAVLKLPRWLRRAARRSPGRASAQAAAMPEKAISRSRIFGAQRL